MQKTAHVEPRDELCNEQNVQIDYENSSKCERMKVARCAELVKSRIKSEWSSVVVTVMN